MISAVVASVCLTALQWMLWATAGLLGVLVVVQLARAEPEAQPFMTIAAALAMAALGWACGAIGRRLAPR